MSTRSLNPYYSGSYSLISYGNEKRNNDGVLILIILEVTL